MSDLWAKIGVDVVQAEKLWEVMVTTQVVLGNSEAEDMSIASIETVTRAYPMMMAPTATSANIPPPLPIRQSVVGGRGPLTTVA